MEILVKINKNPCRCITQVIEELKSKRYTGRIITEFNLNNLFFQLLKRYWTSISSDRIVTLTKGGILIEIIHPSILNYDPNLSISDYLELAGGINDSAFDDIIVIDPDGKTSSYGTHIIFLSMGLLLYILEQLFMLLGK